MRPLGEVVAFAHDPGSANAVGAAIAALRLAGVPARLYAKGPAIERLRLMAIACKPLTITSVSDLEIMAAGLVIVGTAQFDDLEQTALAAAQRLATPSLAVSDFGAIRICVSHPASLTARGHCVRLW